MGNAGRLDIELFREILKDDRLHIGLAQVDRVTVSDDLTNVSVECTLLPEGRPIVATESWDSVGMGSVHGDLPDPKDLVLVAMMDGDPDHAFTFMRLASGEEKLPAQIKDGHFVSKSKPGKKYFLSSDTRIEIGLASAGSPAMEPLVLGLVFKQLMKDELTQLSTLADKVNSFTGQVSSIISQFNSLLTALQGIVGASPGGGIVAPGAPIPASPDLIAAAVAASTQLSAINSQINSLGTDAGNVKTALDNLKASPVNDDTVLSSLAFTEKGS